MHRAAGLDDTRVRSRVTACLSEMPEGRKAPGGHSATAFATPASSGERLMGDPHKHHFIPSFYLSQWANADCKLIEFTRKYNKLIAKPIGPDATGFEIDL